MTLKDKKKTQLDTRWATKNAYLDFYMEEDVKQAVRELKKMWWYKKDIIESIDKIFGDFKL